MPRLIEPYPEHEGIPITVVYEDDEHDVTLRHLFECPVCLKGIAWDTVRDDDPAGLEAVGFKELPVHHRGCAMPRV